jgi:hypothetical protein
MFVKILQNRTNPGSHPRLASTNIEKTHLLGKFLAFFFLSATYGDYGLDFRVKRIQFLSKSYKKQGNHTNGITAPKKNSISCFYTTIT